MVKLELKITVDGETKSVVVENDHNMDAFTLTDMLEIYAGFLKLLTYPVEEIVPKFHGEE